MLGTLTSVVIIAAVVLWLVIISVFVLIRLRNMFQRRKYSEKQDGDVSVSYKSKGLQ